MTAGVASWPAGPPDPSLRPDEIHVWCVDLDHATAGGVDRLLSDDERERSARLAPGGVRARFVVGRATLRTLLGRYLRAEPAALRFTYGPDGKPALAAPGPGEGVSFNVSRSEGLGIYAITHERTAGIDVERIRPVPGADAIAERYFGEAETSALRRLSGPEKDLAFLKLWTTKEACAKAVGTGLDASLRQLRTRVSPDAWSVHELRPTPEHIGAVVAAAPGLSVTCWRLASGA